MNLLEWLEALLKCPSPTYQEAAFNGFLRQELVRIMPEIQIREVKDSLILQWPHVENKPHLALVGHSDVVPAWFEPYREDLRFYGAGASDMKGALASFFYLCERWGSALTSRFNLSLVVYAREEMTPLVENGLYHLIQAFPDYFDSLDLALVGEPTDNTVQIGCVGSIHAQITIPGQACHSARPWNGSNALYNALPVIQALAQLKPVPQRVFGVDFFDVLQITESQSEPGRTSLPGWWKANVNYRFSPVRSLAEAEVALLQHLKLAGVPESGIQILDSVEAGSVIESPLFTEVVQTLAQPVQAKQAWTDVAQLSARGIPAFNYGPGLTAQAHQAHEYLDIGLLELYTASLERLLLA
ncbi:MAG: succinyl-diaminopimelate desuccinylase [Candidatus Sericytochromatia bacterium]|nr:succinyl-diaminopimelate desuccinylase [Candidatus Sericytochromatia bacterium]